MDSDKDQLLKQMQMKDGEVKVLRARQAQLEKTTLKVQLDAMQAEGQLRTQLESVKKENEEKMSKVRAELQFSEMEKTELERRLNHEVKQREMIETQFALLSNNVGSSQRLTFSELSPNTRRKQPRRISNGPAFPNRGSFYGGTPTQPVNAQGASDNYWENGINAAGDFGWPPPKKTCLQSTADADTMTETLILVNNGVQTAVECPSPVAVPETVSHDTEWMRLTSRLRERRPTADNTQRNQCSNEPKLGDIMQIKLVLSLA